MDENAVITLKAVSRYYGSVCAVDRLSVSIARGQILVLLGSSGCGKTTTLRLIAGLERPNAGEIWLDGRVVADDGVWIPPDKRNVGMVFQDYALFPHLNSTDNIAFALRSLTPKQCRARVAELLELVGMNGMGDRYPHQLSGGQQQRIALARALAPHPSVILLDEPFSNLDAFRRKQVREEVRQILKAAGATVVFVTHDQEEAMGIADVIAIMQDGHILQVGEPSVLYRRPEKPEVAKFFGEANWLLGTANGLEVETALGILPLARAAYGSVRVMVRPESLRLERGTKHNAVVKSVRFYGYYQAVRVCLSDDTHLDTRVWAHFDVSPDDAVYVQVEGEVVAFDAQ